MTIRSSRESAAIPVAATSASQCAPHGAVAAVNDEYAKKRTENTVRFFLPKQLLNLGVGEIIQCVEVDAGAIAGFKLIVIRLCRLQ